MIVQGVHSSTGVLSPSGGDAVAGISKQPRQNKTEPTFADILKDEIKELSNSWKEVGNDASLMLKTAPANMQSLFELQAKVNQLQFQVNTASRIGDTAAHSIKRLQQAQG